MMMIFQTGICRCERCGYEWMPRVSGEPRQCPRCKNPKWNVARGVEKVEVVPEVKLVIPKKLAASAGPRKSVKQAAESDGETVYDDSDEYRQ